MELWEHSINRFGKTYGFFLEAAKNDCWVLLCILQHHLTYELCLETVKKIWSDNKVYSEQHKRFNYVLNCFTNMSRCYRMGSGAI